MPKQNTRVTRVDHKAKTVATMSRMPQSSLDTGANDCRARQAQHAHTAAQISAFVTNLATGASPS